MCVYDEAGKLTKSDINFLVNLNQYGENMEYRSQAVVSTEPTCELAALNSLPGGCHRLSKVQRYCWSTSCSGAQGLVEVKRLLGNSPFMTSCLFPANIQTPPIT